MCFFFKQKTAYEMRISDWSSDVCSSDLHDGGGRGLQRMTGTQAGDLDIIEAELAQDGVGMRAERSRRTIDTCAPVLQHEGAFGHLERTWQPFACGMAMKYVAGLELRVGEGLR